MTAVPRKRKPSAIMLQALALIEKRGQFLSPGDFARALWDTESWDFHAVGKTGGAYLWRLWQMGLITVGHDKLTELGKTVLATGRYP